MLHTKFRNNRPAGSGENVLRVFTIYRCGGHLGHVTQMPRTNFRYPYPKRSHKIWLWFERCGWTKKGRRPDDGPLVSYKLTYEPFAQMS